MCFRYRGILGRLQFYGGILHFNRRLSHEVLETDVLDRGAYCVGLGVLWGSLPIARLARPGNPARSRCRGVQIVSVFIDYVIFAALILLTAPAQERAHFLLALRRPFVLF